jgi:hypothetical protein
MYIPALFQGLRKQIEEVIAVRNLLSYYFIGSPERKICTAFRSVIFATSSTVQIVLSVQESKPQTTIQSRIHRLLESRISGYKKSCGSHPFGNHTMVVLSEIAVVLFLGLLVNGHT